MEKETYRHCYVIIKCINVFFISFSNTFSLKKVFFSDEIGFWQTYEIKTEKINKIVITETSGTVTWRHNFVLFSDKKTTECEIK